MRTVCSCFAWRPSDRAVGHGFQMDACRGCCASQIVIGGAAWLRVGPLRNVQRRGLRTEDAGGRQEREGGGRTTGWTDGHLDKEIEGGFEMDGGTRMRREGSARAQHPGRRCISGAQTQQQQSKMRTMLAVVQPKVPPIGAFDPRSSSCPPCSPSGEVVG